MITDYDLTAEEIQKATEIIHREELLAYIPYKNISGGFSNIWVYDVDDKVIKAELTYGVQSDVQNEVTKELLTLDRKTFEWIN